MGNFLVGVKKMKKNTDKETKIFSSKCYEDFKILEKQNRSLRKSHVNKLVLAMTQKNLLKDFPIIISEDAYVLDGQHRLEAAKRLDLPIWYRISNDMVIDDIPLVNSIYLNWSLSDYLNKYLDQNRIDYIKFKRLFDENEEMFSLCQMVKLFYGSRGGTDLKTSPIIKFKRGEFLYPENDLPVKDRIQTVKSFSPYIKLTDRFVSAALKLIKTSGYDHQRMMDKIKQTEGILRPAFEMKQYFVMFNEIYNFNAKNDARVYLKYDKSS